MSTIKTPELIPLDMAKAIGSNHPDIDLEKEYLCLINNKFYSGHFNKQHYGLSFHGGPFSMQFDAPGYNSSNWQQIFEIVVKEPLPEAPSSKRRREAIENGLSKEPLYASDVYKMYENGFAEQTSHDILCNTNRWWVEITEELKTKYSELKNKSLIYFYPTDDRGYPYANKVVAE